MTIEIPDWCIVGKWVEWKCPEVTGNEWVRERIISFTQDGFYHRDPNCPVYYSRFSDYGKTIRECRNNK